MYHTTGFAKDEIIDLCALVYANEVNCDIDPWPPSLGLYKSVVIALTYMRRNRVQQELAETYESVHSRGSVNWCQAMAGSGGSQGFPAMALLMASSAVMPWAAAESR